MPTQWERVLERVDENQWRLPQSYKAGMRVPGIIFASDAMVRRIGQDQSLDQVANVAFLPGIVLASFGMPDIHWGYGFPVGGVAATRVRDGVVSPGGVGFDINCGVRLLRTSLTEEEVRPRLEELVSALFADIPTGVGAAGKLKVGVKELDKVMTQGARWAVANGYGEPDDLETTEEHGAIGGADPEAVGPRPRQRGAGQLGTLGSGNHFLEVQVVDEVFDGIVAEAMGIRLGQVTVLIHCGSRGFGHQVCEDYLRTVEPAMQRYGIQVPDRQLACVPVTSPEGRSYLAAMRCAANFAWANRQCIAHWTRESFSRVFGQDWYRLGMTMVYDVCHNIAKVEKHMVEGKRVDVCIHRKGATRSFPPGHPELPERYRRVGQPVMVPGDMGRYSFLAVGTETAMERSLGSTCHGAGRTESRGAAKRLLKGHDVQKELRRQGIVVMARGWASLAEEASIAYKDVAEVVDVCHNAGLANRVARMRPLGVIKG